MPSASASPRSSGWRTYLSTHDSAQHIHKFEPIDKYTCRHVPDRDECWLCVQLDVIRAALDNAYERSLPPVIREAEASDG